MKEGLSQFYTYCTKQKEMEQNNEKHLTKYDRKRLAKEAAAKREKRNKTISLVAVVAVIVVIIALIVLIPLGKRKKSLGEYIRINDTSVSQLEFNYHKASIFNNYYQILPYYGVDTSVSLDEQIYDAETGMTWNEFFDQRAVSAIQEYKALVSDAEAKGLTFDITEDYNAFVESMQAAADTVGMSLQAYYTAQFGTTANEKMLKPIVETELTALAYYNYLVAESTATDEEAQAAYDEDPDQYDSIDYRVLAFEADVTSASTEDEIAAAMEETTAKAQEMLDRVNAGEDFETLCAEYAPEDDRLDYEDTETDYSLQTDLTLNTSYHAYTDWLFEDRAEGDTTLYTEEDYNTVYALKFEKRYMGDTVMDTIKENLSYEKVDEYIDTLLESYIISDPHGNLSFSLEDL